MHKVTTGVTDDVPQWSPPLDGGSNGTVLANAWAGQRAAMEPAGERREQPFNILGNIQLNDVPQWSPPVNGGNTGVTHSAQFAPAVPQWSPPVNGGSRKGFGDPYAIATLPQWSPPVNGGSSWIDKIATDIYN